uniref:t-SNARE coiled-coil homology domain-containing protein n=1 Tax=Ditylenchus dipsaci TaxID=166011 RepID=A0A915DI58_9BILA
MTNPRNKGKDFYSSRDNRAWNMEPVRSYTFLGSIEDEVAGNTFAHDTQIDKYLQMSLESTQRSRQQLESSEQLANSAARDLLEQREKLERTEKNLDDIHKTTQLTQRSLNKLKSFFGGFFKNKISKKPKELQISTSDTDGEIHQSIQSVQSTADRSFRNSNNSATRKALMSGGVSSISKKMKSTQWEELSHCSDEMSLQLERLRSLGTSLGNELDGQNKLLDRIHEKAGRNGEVIQRQDKQMKNLIGDK